MPYQTSLESHPDSLARQCRTFSAFSAFVSKSSFTNPGFDCVEKSYPGNSPRPLVEFLRPFETILYSSESQDTSDCTLTPTEQDEVHTGSSRRLQNRPKQTNSRGIFQSPAEIVHQPHGKASPVFGIQTIMRPGRSDATAMSSHERSRRDCLPARAPGRVLDSRTCEAFYVMNNISKAYPTSKNARGRSEGFPGPKQLPQTAIRPSSLLSSSQDKPARPAANNQYSSQNGPAGQNIVSRLFAVFLPF